MISFTSKLARDTCVESSLSLSLSLSLQARNTSIPALCLSTTQSKSYVHIRPYNPPASSHGARGGVLIVKVPGTHFICFTQKYKYWRLRSFVPGGPTRAPKYDTQQGQQNLAKESERQSQTKPRSRSVNEYEALSY